MQFCDYAKILVESGAGGKGCVSFRREKNIPFGGPDGGHGGRGGHIIFRVSRNLMTLIDFRYRSHIRASSGKQGQGRRKAGLHGKDITLLVPPGTELWVDTFCVADLIHNDEEFLLLKGGLGGHGNGSMASSIDRAPRVAGLGEPGSSLWVELKLKVMADLGLIGPPNAGKSTLLRTLTQARPKVGDYPFTTLVPQLGTWVSPDYKEIVLADLPGLIEGAHEGKGLGHRFLSHGQRCKGLLYILDGTSPTLLKEYEGLRYELETYNASLIHKQQAIILTKSDLMNEEQKKVRFSCPTFVVSALQQEGLEALENFLCQFAH